jgi:hypothetical protein
MTGSPLALEAVQQLRRLTELLLIAPFTRRDHGCMRMNAIVNGSIQTLLVVYR